MKTTKRIICLILTFIVVMSFVCSCGNSSENKNNDEADDQNTPDINSDIDNDIDSESTTELKQEPAIVPDIDFYLNTAPDSTSGEYSVYCFKGNPTDAAKNYVSVLQDKYGMTLEDSYEDGTTLGWHLQKENNENADVDISVNCTGGINWELWISFGSDVELKRGMIRLFLY